MADTERPWLRANPPAPVSPSPGPSIPVSATRTAVSMRLTNSWLASKPPPPATVISGVWAANALPFSNHLLGRFGPGNFMKGKRVLVIGGSTGIGEGIATRVLNLGATVVISSHTPAKLAAAQSRLGPAVTTELVDVAHEEQVKGLFERVGPVDHVVFSAGAVLRGPFKQITT